VKSQDILKDFACRPLYARMIIEIGRKNPNNLTNAVNEYNLVDHFVNATFKRKEHLSVYKNHIDAKIQCLIVIAGYLLRNNYSWGNIEELQQEVNTSLLTHGADQIRNFFRTEVSVYSLMQPIGEGCVEFSHETIHDYFTVRYLGKIWEVRKQDGLAKYLGVQQLSDCAIRFLIQHFGPQQEQLCNFAIRYKDDEEEILRANCKNIIDYLSSEGRKNK
jgi:hypothetical protein